MTTNAALQELRALVSTYLEGSDDAARAAELLDALDQRATSPAAAIQPPTDAQVARQREMFGCTAAAIDEALADKEPRDVAMYAMGTLSNAQELIQRGLSVAWFVEDRDANKIRQLINVAKYAIDKAVPR